MDRWRVTASPRWGQMASMGLLTGKHIVVTGVLTDASLAFGVAKLAQEEGADVVLTGAGRGLSLTERTARKLPAPAPVFELDVAEPSHVAPASCLGGGFMEAPWEDVAVALNVSAYSLKTLADAFVPLMTGGGSMVGLDFDARVAWPAYDWMGVAKAALESTSRYLARELGGRGVRVNLVAAGPIRTMAAKSIPGFSKFEDVWADRAPLGWDVNDSTAVARACVALLSDWFPLTTGELIHVDGGYHAMGA
jgi:enoyl ACP reductase